MPKFGKTSQLRLIEAHPDLQRLFSEVIKHFDCTVICGYRGQAEQEAAKAAGKSKASFGQSPHNYQPALAVDVVPYPVDWEDRERMFLFAGVVLGMAVSMGVGVTWGGDWDRDTEVKDNSFDDLLHFELIDWRTMI
jgi:hypothetical protein